jgi:serine protease Do
VRGGRSRRLRPILLPGNLVQAEYRARTEEQLAQLSGGGSANEGTEGATSTVAPQRALGLSLAQLTPELAKAANLPPNSHGVIITAVDANSDAGDEGLQRGDLIVSVNNQLVTTPAQVVTAVEGARRSGRSSVLLLIKRGNSPEGFVGVDISGR